MYVKVLYGRHAGTVRDLSNDVALDMIKLGRASRAFEDPKPAPIVEPPRGDDGPPKSRAKAPGKSRR